MSDTTQNPTEISGPHVPEIAFPAEDPEVVAAYWKKIQDGLDQIFPEEEFGELRRQLLTPPEAFARTSEIVSGFSDYASGPEAKRRLDTLSVPPEDVTDVFLTVGPNVPNAKRYSREEGKAQLPREMEALYWQIFNWLKEGGTGNEIDRNTQELYEMGDISPRLLALAQEVAKFRLASGNISSERGLAPTDPEHLQPVSQGGFGQVPIHPVVHYFLHAKRVEIASKAIDRVLEILERDPDNPVYNEILGHLTAAYIINVAGAEATRSTSFIGTTLSKDAVKRRNSELALSAEEKLAGDEFKQLRKELTWLNDQDPAGFVAVIGKATELQEKYDSKNLTNNEKESVEKLGAVARYRELQIAKDETESLLRSLSVDCNDESVQRAIEIVSAFSGSLSESIHNISSDFKASDHVDLETIKSVPELYEAIVLLQEKSGKVILPTICLPPRVCETRLPWSVQVDYISGSGYYPMTFDTGGTFWRKAYDLVSEKTEYKVGSSGVHIPHALSSEEMNRIPELDKMVNPNLEFRQIVAAYVGDELVGQYCESLGLTGKEELNKHLNPSEYDIDPASALQGVEVLARKILDWVNGNNKIALIGDCDQDGFYSSVETLSVLDLISNEKVESVLQTRTQGHGVRISDFINFGVSGICKFLIHDTGSSVEDALAFQLVREGVANSSVVEAFENLKKSLTESGKLEERGALRIPVLESFSSVMEEVTTFADFDQKTRGLINRKVRAFEKFLCKKYRDTELTKEALATEITALLEKKVKSDGEYFVLKDILPVALYFSGNANAEFGITDHHTASVQGVQLLMNCDYVTMVNPQWVIEGREEEFIEDMNAALSYEGKGKVEKIKRVQKRYFNSDKDIVGTVVVSKVMERLLELYGVDMISAEDHPLRRRIGSDELKKIITSDDSEFRTVTDKEREQRLNSLTQRIVKDAGLEKAEISVGDITFEFDLHNKWERRGALALTMKEISAARRSLVAEIDLEIEKRMSDDVGLRRSEAVENIFSLNESGESIINEILTNFQVRHGVRVIFTEAIRERLKTSSMETILSEVQFDLESGKVEDRYWNSFVGLKLNPSEKRLLLSFHRQMPLNYYQKTPEEKLEQYNSIMFRIASRLEEIEVIDRNGTIHNLNGKEIAEEIMLLGGNLSALKRRLSKEIKGIYNEFGTLAKKRGGGYLKLETATSKFVSQIWDDALEQAHFQDYEREILHNFEKAISFDFLQIEFARAIAQVGDGGLVGKDGIEGRAIVKTAQRKVEQRIEELVNPEIPRSVRNALGNDPNKIKIWKQNRKKLLKKFEPPILDMLRASLSGERLTSLTLLLTRILSHQLAAGANAAFRSSAVKGMDNRARKKLSQNLNLFAFGAKTREEKIDRANLLDEHIRAIEAREVLMKKVIKYVEDNKLYENSVIVIKISGKINEPTEGFRGLIAGELAALYGKPVIVITMSGHKRKNGSYLVGISARTPGDGNGKLNWDNVLRSEEYSPQNKDKLRMITCGGHPCAAGGLAEVCGDTEDAVLEIITNTFRDACTKYEYKQLGVIALNDVETIVKRRLRNEGFPNDEYFMQQMDVFEMLRDLAEISNDIIHPTGADVPYIQVRLVVEVLSVSQVRTKEGKSYRVIKVKDMKGHTTTFRSFDSECNFNWGNIKSTIEKKSGSGNPIIEAVIEPRLRNRPSPIREITHKVKYKGKVKEKTLETKSYTGRTVKPTLDVVAAKEYSTLGNP